MDVCSGCNGLLMVSGEDELLLNELNELDRSTGVVLNKLCHITLEWPPQGIELPACQAGVPNATTWYTTTA